MMKSSMATTQGADKLTSSSLQSSSQRVAEQSLQIVSTVHVPSKRDSIDQNEIQNIQSSKEPTNKASATTLSLDNKVIEYTAGVPQPLNTAQNAQGISIQLLKPNKTQMPPSVEPIVSHNATSNFSSKASTHGKHNKSGK